MNASIIALKFAGETHTCAMQMMENATYIQKQLSVLTMPDTLRTQIEEVCSSLLSTKHDLIHELSELDEILNSESEVPTLQRWIERIRDWISGEIVSLNQCVMTVQAAVDTGAVDSLVLMLVMESATNVIVTTPALPEDWEAPKPEIDEDEDLEDEDDHEENDDCFAFNLEDSHPIRQLTDTIACLTDRPELSSETRQQLRVFLFAMKRLPVMTPEIRMSLGLRLDQGGESDWIEIRMEDDEFSLGRGSWIDGDAATETVFEVSQGYRDGDAFVATNFADSFARCAEDVCRELVIEDFSDEPFTAWDLAQDKTRWNSLPCSFL